MLNGLSRLLFVFGDGNNPSNPAGNDRILEQGPPTYEEALTLFKRDTGSSRSNSSGDRGSRATRGAGANGRRSSSRDYEMAERLQREELARARAGRNASLAHAGRRSDGRRWSSPGGNAAQSQGSRRGAIPESELHLVCLLAKSTQLATQSIG